ncbi:MAG: hypothetical protein K8W52_40845 [Deltaproteobacteria bacterium]|nr:hypothetical protein [Deltaproteobacteria bacterium]
MLRYLPRLVPPGTSPTDALVLPLIDAPPTSPLGEHTLIPEIAWMVEAEGGFVHVPAGERDQLETMRGSAILTMLDGELANEPLDHVPGAFASTGAYAAELLLDRDHLTQLHAILGVGAYLAGAPRRGRFLFGGVRSGLDGMRAFVAHVRREHDAAPAADRISPVALLVRGGAPTAIVGDLQLAALAQAGRGD